MVMKTKHLYFIPFISSSFSSQVHKDRADPAVRVQQADQEILDLLVGLGCPDLWALLGLQATVTRTPVWATTLEVCRVP